MTFLVPPLVMMVKQLLPLVKIIHAAYGDRIKQNIVSQNNNKNILQSFFKIYFYILERENIFL